MKVIVMNIWLDHLNHAHAFAIAMKAIYIFPVIQESLLNFMEIRKLSLRNKEFKLYWPYTGQLSIERQDIIEVFNSSFCKKYAIELS